MNDLARYGWDDRVAGLFASVAGDDTVPGRVGRVERSVRTAHGTGPSAVVHLGTEDVLATAADLPAVGDWVAVRLTEPGEPALIEAILPRWSALTRQDPSSEQAEQVLAANVDVVLIVAPLDRLRVARIERELLVAWESGAIPVVVLSKADLVEGADTTLAALRDRLAGTDVILTSALEGAGIEAIAQVLQPNRTAVLFGPSGGGKSTLANALLGGDVMPTGAVREGDHRGRHTTTSRHLLPLARGGVLIDTPGLRSVGVWRGEHGLATAFADVEAHVEHCRFRDCRHEREPGCAVLAAVDAGELAPERVASYLKLLREIEQAEQRPAPRTRRR